VQEGAKVILADLNEDGVSRAAKELGSDDTAVPYKFDVTNEQQWADILKLAVDKFGTIDILVNNGIHSTLTYSKRRTLTNSGEAGTSYVNKPTMDVTPEEFDRVFNVNVRSIFLSAKAIVPQMKKQGGGSIINVSSTGSIRPRPGLVWYNASKGAVSNVCDL
jgi:NAD(P)-dependent dehydrogenase (short-subunit alcohol dehydrogenase family)